MFIKMIIIIFLNNTKIRIKLKINDSRKKIKGSQRKIQKKIIKNILNKKNKQNIQLKKKS